MTFLKKLLKLAFASCMMANPWLKVGFEKLEKLCKFVKKYCEILDTAEMRYNEPLLYID